MVNKSKKFSLGLYEKAMPNHLTWVEKLTYAKKAGYDSVEISIDESDARLARLIDPKQQREIKEAILEVGLPVLTMCLSGHRRFPIGHPDESIREKGMEIFYQAIDLASYLGVRIIQLAGYDVYYEESTEESVSLFGENLPKGIEYASSKGIICGFETMETDFMNSVSKAMAYVNRVNSPYLQVYPDLGNITNSALKDGRDVLEDIQSGHGHLVAAHLKETKPGIFREVEFGEGHVDFEAGIKALWDAGVRFFGCEFWYSTETDFIERLSHNINYVKAFLDKQGD